MATGDGDVIQENIAFRVASSRGGFAVKEETGTSVGATFNNQQRRPFGEVICAGGGGGTSRAGFHFLEQVGTENRGGFRLYLRNTGVFAHFLDLQINFFA